MESVYKQDSMSQEELGKAYVDSILTFYDEMDKAIKAGDKFLVGLYKESIRETFRELSSQPIVGRDGKVITMEVWVKSEVSKLRAEAQIAKDKAKAQDGVITNIQKPVPSKDSTISMG